MPCSDSGRDPHEGMDCHKVIAALCAVMTALEATDSDGDVLAEVNWSEAGISRDWLKGWWKKHKAEDRERRRYEAAEARKRQQKRNAIAKLTPEEREALGIRLRD